MPELTFTKLTLKDNYIEVAGTFHKIMDIPFLARIRIVSVFQNIMSLRIERVKVLKIGIPKFILNTASKMAAKKLWRWDWGIENKTILVNIDKALQKVPHVHLEVDHFIMENGVLSLRLKGIEADIEAMQKEANKDNEAEERKQQELEAEKIRIFNEKLQEIRKTEDSYSEFRDKIMQKVPYDRKNLAKYGFILPDMYALALRLMKDKRVTRETRPSSRSLLCTLWCLWIIPSKVPVLGKVDDIAIFFFGTNYIMKKIPVPILVKHWQGDLATLKLVKDNIETILNFTPGKTLQSGLWLCG